jgi:RNA polymerase primary sigma factor
VNHGSERLKQPRKEWPIEDLLARMDGREASILRLRCGPDGENPMTLKAIGDRLGLTRERVRQIEMKALAELRKGVEAA